MAEEERLTEEQRTTGLAGAEEVSSSQDIMLEDSMFSKLDSLLAKSQTLSELLLEKMGDCVSVEEPKDGRGRRVKRKAAAAAVSQRAPGACRLLSADEEDRTAQVLDKGCLTEEVLVAHEQKEIIPLLTGGQLKPLELKGVKWMIALWQNGMSGILADQVRLQKTIQAIGLLAYHKGRDMTYGPFLIIAPRSTLSNWVSELKKWVPAVPVIVYHGTNDERAQIRSNVPASSSSPKFPVFVTSYEVAISDRTHLSQWTWTYGVADGSHSLKSFDYKLLRRLRNINAVYKVFLTDNPVPNNLSELYSLLEFIEPLEFICFEQFESWFDFEGRQRFNEGERDEQRRVDVVTKLHSILRPFVLRRLSEDVMKTSPPENEVVFHPPLTEKNVNQPFKAQPQKGPRVKKAENGACAKEEEDGPTVSEEQRGFRVTEEHNGARVRKEKSGSIAKEDKCGTRLKVKRDEACVEENRTCGKEEKDGYDGTLNLCERMAEEVSLLEEQKGRDFSKLDTVLAKSQIYSQFLLEKIETLKYLGDEPKEGLGRGRGVKRKAAAEGAALVSQRSPKASPSLSDGDEDEVIQFLDDECLTDEVRVAQEQKEIIPLLTGGHLKPFQLKGIKWMIALWRNGLNCILADQIGLGKTIQAIGLLAHHKGQDMSYGPFLIIAPLSTLSDWVSEFRKWVPTVPVILYHGTNDERAQMRATMPESSSSPEFPVVVTSYEVAIFDRTYLSRRTWKYVVIDEGHRLRNFDSKLFRELRKVQVENKLLLTCTPLQNNVSELWSLLNFILPQIFTSLEQFEWWFDSSGRWSNGLNTEESDQQRRVEVATKLHKILRPFVLRRLNEEVMMGNV